MTKQAKAVDVPEQLPETGKDPGLDKLLADRDRAYAEREARLPDELKSQARQAEVDAAGRTRTSLPALSAVRDLVLPPRSSEAVRAREAARAGSKQRKGKSGGSRRGRSR